MGKPSKPLYERQEIRFECKMCGACCSSWTGEVHVRRSEVPRLARQLGISELEFIRRYSHDSDARFVFLRTDQQGNCPFFESEKCVIHEFKPVMCRIYPCWPEVVDSGEEWEEYVKSCPGLGTGPALSPDEIRRKLEEARSD